MKKVLLQFKENEQVKMMAYTLKKDVNKQVIINNENLFIRKLKEDIPAATEIHLMVEISNPQINKKLLQKIGSEVAAEWGSQLLKVKTYPSLVVFECVEDNEYFTTTMTYDEIKEEYKNYF